MKRAYRFLLRPTTKQVQALAACVEDHRQLYNAALQERRAAYQRAKVSVRYGEQSAQLKAREQVVAVHAKIRRQRLDQHHKTALALVRRYDLIAHEDLRISGMTRSAAGTIERPGTNVAQKSGLNRSILDAGWGRFLDVLHAKAESAGRVVVAVNAANTSRTCPECGHCDAANRVTQAELVCVACGYTAHADVNAARNVLRAGLALQTATAA